MKRLRVIALIMGALLLVAVPAWAQAQTYVGKSEATGFELSITPPGEDQAQGLIVGVTEAGVQSGGEDACSAGEVACAFAEALLGFSGAAEASQPGGEAGASVVGGEIPAEELIIARFGVAEASAADAPNPGAGAVAAASQIDLTLTQTLFDDDALGPVRDGVKDGIDQLLGPIEENDPSGEVGPRLKGLVDYVFENLGNAPLATIEVGTTTSTSEHVDGVTTVEAAAQGVTLTLVPPPVGSEVAALAPDGLAQVVVGDSRASATTDGQTGGADAAAAPVTLRIFDPGTQEYQEIAVEPGVLECSPEELDPLRICVSVGGTQTTEDGAGAAARAVAAGVELFDGETLPLVTLALAEAEAAVNAAVPAPPEPEPDLPRTGGNLAVPGIAFLAVAIVTGAAGRRRRL